MASGMLNGRPVPRGDLREPAGSVVGYIPDDVSSIHSSAMGGVGVSTGYPPMFQGFTPDTWPSVHNPNTGAGRQNGVKPRPVPGSVAGESTVATESDITGSFVGQGGVSLDQLSIHGNNKQPSYNQADRLKRYVENGPATGNFVAKHRLGKAAHDDEDARSVSTAFASQVGGGYD